MSVHVRAKLDAIKAAVLSVPSRATQGESLADAMLLRVGTVLLGHIRRNFLIKASGGTDETGDKWQPLSPKTIAYRTRRTKTERGRNARPSQALTKKQQERWWEVYRRNLARFKGDKGHAAAAAWLVLKGEGARTLVDKYGYRRAEILRDTGLLLDSLSPGSGSAEQILTTSGGEVVIGTSRKGAMSHHNGIPGRLPQRRLWPEPSKWPNSWWKDINEQVKQGMSDIITQLVKSV